MEIARIIPVTESILVSSTVAEAETLWSGATTYGNSARVYRLIDGVHQAFVSQQALNTNHIPETDNGTWWKSDGPTNRWAAIDTAMGSVTTGTGTISYTFQLPANERVDVVYLAGLVGAQVQVVMEDPYEGVVVDKTVSLSDPGNILDHYDYCFNEVTRFTELLFTNLSRGAGATITVTITEEDEPVAVGTIVFGFAERIGGTQWGAEVSNRDYSAEIENDFGDEVIVRRGFRKLAAMQVVVENRVFDAVTAKLNALRGTLTLFIGDSRFSSLVILGRYESYRMAMELGDERSLLSIQTKSLVQ